MFSGKDEVLINCPFDVHGFAVVFLDAFCKFGEFHNFCVGYADEFLFGFWDV